MRALLALLIVLAGCLGTVDEPAQLVVKEPTYIPGDARFGVFLDGSRKDDEYVLDDAIELGSGSTRIMLPWDLIEPTKGNYELEIADIVINTHKRRRYTVVATVLSNNRGATGTEYIQGRAPSKPANNPRNYEDFIRTLVRRYRGAIQYWQIENEINNINNWNGTSEEYKDQLIIAYRVIKEEDPDAKVVLTGLPGSFFIALGAGNEQAARFAEDTIVSCAPYYDVIDVHQYKEYDSILGIEKVIKELLEKNDLEKELICTEAGDFDLRLFSHHFNPNDDSPKIVGELMRVDKVRNAVEAISEEGLDRDRLIDLSILLATNPESMPILERYQAESLVKRISLTLTTDVSMVMWLGMHEQTVPSDWFWPQIPLIDTTGRKKPSFYSYKMLIENLKGFENSERIEDDLLKFSFKDGRQVFVAWGDADLEKIGRESVTVKHIVTDLDGDFKPIYMADEQSRPGDIKLGETPVFIL